jgi:hypothetical protein
MLRVRRSGYQADAIGARNVADSGGLFTEVRGI